MQVLVPWTLFGVFLSLFIVFYYQSRLRSWLARPISVTVAGVSLFQITRTRVLGLLQLCTLLPLLVLTFNWKF